MSFGNIADAKIQQYYCDCNKNLREAAKLRGEMAYSGYLSSHCFSFDVRSLLISMRRSG